MKHSKINFNTQKKGKFKQVLCEFIVANDKIKKF